VSSDRFFVARMRIQAMYQATAREKFAQSLNDRGVRAMHALPADPRVRAHPGGFRFCTQCGSKIQNTDSFCTECGAVSRLKLSVHTNRYLCRRQLR
jgi:hypothetical protein